MLENNNILPFMLTFMPALVYTGIIFLSFSKTISLKISFLYFLMGSLGVTAVSAFHWIFPEWKHPLVDDFVYTIWILAFLQVALLEESFKLLFFRFTEMYRRRLPNKLSVMFYSMSVSAGFGVVENMLYAWRFGHQVLWPRATSTIVLHMIAGLMMGYFISLGMLDKNKWKRWMYSGIGLASAVFIHGLYDFNIMVSHREYFSRGDLIYVPTGMGVDNWYVLGAGLTTTLLMLIHLKWIRGRRRASPPSGK